MSKQKQIVDNNPNEPIKCAITSNMAVDNRTFIIYKDGGVKIIEQGDSDREAVIVYLYAEEIQEILQAIKAP